MLIKTPTQKSRRTSHIKYCYLMLFAMLYLTADIASNILVYRMIKVGSLIVSAGMIAFAFTYFFNDIVTELYGYKYARLVIWYDLLCSSLFSLFAILVLKLPYPYHWHNEHSFEVVLGQLLWISIGCIIAAILSEFLNIYLFTKLKILMRGKYFFIRSMCASAGGQLVLVLICIPMYFWSRYNLPSLIELMLVSYLFLLIFTAIIAIPLTFVTLLIKRSVKLDVFDYTTNFNPFRST